MNETLCFKNKQKDERDNYANKVGNNYSNLWCRHLQCSFTVREKNVNGSIWLVIGTIALGIMSSFIYDNIKLFLPHPVNSVPSISTPNNDSDIIDYDGTNSTEDNEDFSSSKSDTIPDIQEDFDPIHHMKDITGQSSISGKRQTIRPTLE